MPGRPALAVWGVLLPVLALLGGTLGAQQLPVPVPAPAPAPEASAEPGALEGPRVAERLRLPTGIVVLVAERPALPIVTIRAAVRVGSVHDPPDRAGLANLTALLLPRGTATRTGPEIDRAIEFAGGRLEADGGRDLSTVTLSVLRRDLPLGLDLLADVLLRPAFRLEEFERRRDLVRAQVRRSEEEPREVAGRLLRRLAFPGHPYGAPVTGTEPSLGRITRDDVVAFHAGAYRPEATTIAVAGAVTLAEMRAALIARFGAWAVAGVPPPAPGPMALGTPAGTETVQRDLAQATVLVGKATISRAHPDYYPLVVASHILGGGSASRLYARVREERGLAYSVYGHYAPALEGGLVVVGLQSENARVREALALVRGELVRLRRERVGEEELARAKAYLVGSFPLRMDTNAEMAALLVDIETLGLGLDYPTRHRRGVDSVTADDVLRAARTHLDPDQMSLALVGNLRQAGFPTP